jgi:hypothetical protein
LDGILPSAPGQDQRQQQTGNHQAGSGESLATWAIEVHHWRAPLLIEV